MKLDEFIQKFAEQFYDTDASEFTADCSYKDLAEWSSLTAMSIIAFIKTDCGKSITAREIRSCETIEDLYNHVQGMR